MIVTKVAFRNRVEIGNGKLFLWSVLASQYPIDLRPDGGVEVDGLEDGKTYVFPAASIAYLVCEPGSGSSEVTSKPSPTSSTTGAVAGASTAVAEFQDEPTVVTRPRKARR